MNEIQLNLFAERLTKLRQKRQLTQQQLGDVLQIPRVSITRYETAERTPTVDHLVQFAQFFKVPTDYLLGLSSVESYDIELQAVCDYTGLSEEAVKELNMDLDPPFKTKVKYLTELHKILSWLINESYIHEIISYLVSIRDYSQEYLTFEEEINNNGLYLTNDKKAEQTELNNINKLYELEKNIDFERYMLVKLSERLSNHFDQREQVKNNGKHNPPKE